MTNKSMSSLKLSSARVVYVLHPMMVKPSRRHIGLKNFEWVLSVGSIYGPIVDIYKIMTKLEAERTAAALLRSAAEDYGQRSELRVRGRDGKYKPARTYPASSDPKRSKG